MDTTLSFSISVDSVPEPEEQIIEEDEIDTIIVNDENQNEKKEEVDKEKDKEERKAEKRREREKKKEERRKLRAEKMKSKDGNKIVIVVDELDEEEMDGFPEEIVNIKQKKDRKGKLRRSEEVEEDLNGEITDKEKKANRALRRTQSESCMR